MLHKSFELQLSKNVQIHSTCKFLNKALVHKKLQILKPLYVNYITYDTYLKHIHPFIFENKLKKLYSVFYDMINFVKIGRNFRNLNKFNLKKQHEIGSKPPWGHGSPCR